MRTEHRNATLPETLPGEVLVPVTGHTGYWVSNLGRVWSEFRSGRWLSQNKSGKYYASVSMGSRQKGGGTKFVHTLVGRAFLPHGGTQFVICHRDETLPVNEVNALSNLWVGTISDNHNDKETKGRGTRKEVEVEGVTYPSLGEAALALGVNRVTLSRRLGIITTRV